MKETSDSFEKQQEKNRLEVLDYVDSLSVSNHSKNSDFNNSTDDGDMDKNNISSMSGSNNTSETKSIKKKSNKQRESGVEKDADTLENNKIKTKPSISSTGETGMDGTSNKKSIKETTTLEDAPAKTALERQGNHNVVGVVRVHGDEEEEPHPESDSIHSSSSSSSSSSIRHEAIKEVQIHATLVEDKDLETATFDTSIPTVKAEKVVNKTNRKLYAIIAVLLLIVLGLAIGIPLAQRNDDDKSDDREHDSEDDRRGA